MEVQVDDFDIKKLNYEFIHSCEFWQNSVRKCDHNTAIKYLSNFRKIVNICINNGWLTRDPLVGYKLAKREVERLFLVEEELTKIINKEFIMPRLRQVRDIFWIAIKMIHNASTRDYCCRYLAIKR